LNFYNCITFFKEILFTIFLLRLVILLELFLLSCYPIIIEFPHPHLSSLLACPFIFKFLLIFEFLYLFMSPAVYLLLDDWPILLVDQRTEELLTHRWHGLKEVLYGVKKMEV
jgi:hypothetical protein